MESSVLHRKLQIGLLQETYESLVATNYIKIEGIRD